MHVGAIAPGNLSKGPRLVDEIVSVTFESGDIIGIECFPTSSANPLCVNKDLTTNIYKNGHLFETGITSLATMDWEVMKAHGNMEATSLSKNVLSVTKIREDSDDYHSCLGPAFGRGCYSFRITFKKCSPNTTVGLTTADLSLCSHPDTATATYCLAYWGTEMRVKV